MDIWTRQKNLHSWHGRKNENHYKGERLEVMGYGLWVTGYGLWLYKRQAEWNKGERETPESTRRPDKEKIIIGLS